ncbi:Transposable element P transposase [Frankliniella fusca]|uniref:Transposable element P transposase n=1 Tax=Frankliniella fusca TaxID=407009 RepID=A0AAE1H7R1_9NEOP|nr:Transposable element P transposase [Frankliniella fusca]
MYISKNLVFQKSSGRIVGYTKLDEADREVRALNEYLDDPNSFEGKPAEEIADKVLCYMIKGTSNGIKEVVASYAVKNVSCNQMYLWSWRVIGALERNGIKVVAFVCDGSTTNRAFINLHTPVTKLNSGIVIDTVNKAAPDRVLYFMADVAHLLKTIRNCFYKSRNDKSKGKRCMKRRGKRIVWDFIIRLYKEEKNRSLRKAYKLSPVNVFPDSFSCMKVCYAAQVLSRTVGHELKRKNYPGVSETVKFIFEVNDWFDRLNGAHSSVGKKKRNSNLDPYTSRDDPRFQQLEEFLKYLDDWKAEAYSSNASVCNSVNESGFMNESDLSEADVSFNPVEDVNDDDDDTKAGQRILSHQTLVGIETTTRSFIKCVQFLIDEGTSFINARIFSQDPLEQHFSKQRAGGGGSTNPNLWKFLSKSKAIHIQGQLGIKRRKGNSAETETEVQVTTEPLAKRKSVKTQKISL